MQSRIAVLVMAAASGLVASPADAYTLRETPAGEPVRWSTETVRIVVDPSLSAIGPGAIEAVEEAFAAWSEAAGEHAPTVVAEPGQADDVGWRKDASNRSTVRFAPEGSDLAGGALAITVITYDGEGHILDADVIVNGGGPRRFGVLPGVGTAKVQSEGPASAVYDLQNVLAHEAGHFFGLGEELSDRDATMFVSSVHGETKKRDLASDDVAGARALYGEPLDEDDVSTGSCAARGGHKSARSGIWALVAASAWTASRRRARGVQGARSARGRGAVAGVALAGLVAAGSPPASGADSGGASARALLGEASRADAVLSVVGATARWENGIAVTELRLRTEACREEASRGACPSGEVTIDVLGGRIGDITQIVGHAPVPHAGDRVALRIEADRFVWPTSFPIVRGARREHEPPAR